MLFHYRNFGIHLKFLIFVHYYFILFAIRAMQSSHDNGANKESVIMLCSDVSSLPHGLGKWVTEMLLPLAQKQASYFKDSFAFNDMLDDITVPANRLLFTSDATSMYTKKITEPAIAAISAYIHDTRGDTEVWKALINALGIVFRNNLFKFSDTTWRQISGTGMGISPAPHGTYWWTKSLFTGDLLMMFLASG
jgi:hypothetical protein